MRHAWAAIVGELKKTRSSLASLAFSLSGEYVYSLLLVASKSYLVAFPLITSLIPVMASIRGGVYSSIGSKVSTLLHLGYNIGGLRSSFARRLHRSVLLVLALLGAYTALLTGLLHPDIGLFDALYAALASLALAHLVIFPLVLKMARSVFSRGLDPDNIMAPLVALLGDIWTVPALLASVLVLAYYGWLAALAFLLALVTVNGFLALPLRRSEEPLFDPHFARQLGSSMFIALLLEVMAGLALSSGIEGLADEPGLLASLPIMMQAGGAIASISASRISTRLHLGNYPPSLLPPPALAAEYLRSLVLAILGYSLAALIGWASAGTLGYDTSITTLLGHTIGVGIVVLLLAPLIAHFLGVVVFKKGWDPDNVSIPLLTSAVDLVTVLLVLGID